MAKQVKRSFNTREEAEKYRKENRLKKRIIVQEEDKWYIRFDSERFNYDVNKNKDKEPGYSRKDYINIARDLYYPQKVIDLITNAKSQEEIQHILTSARKGEYK